MNILFIDTHAKLARVHFIRDGKIVTEESFGEKNHSVNILPLVKKALGETLPRDIDVVSVANGPGSYTGLRIALTTAKTLAFAIEKPLVTIDTLTYLALSNTKPNIISVPLIDARNNRAFYAVYKTDACGNIAETLEKGADDIFEIKKRAEAYGLPVVYSGDAANNILGENSDLGNGRAVLRIVEEMLKKHDLADFSPEKAEANYMKDVHVTLKQ